MNSFNSLVAENPMKPGPIHPNNDGLESDWNWAEADGIASYAREKGLQ